MAPRARSVVRSRHGRLRVRPVGRGLGRDGAHRPDEARVAIRRPGSCRLAPRGGALLELAFSPGGKCLRYGIYVVLHGVERRITNPCEFSGSGLVRGTPFRDYLEGSPRPDRLLGGGRRDHIGGGAGDDVLDGDGGWDTLLGGPGATRSTAAPGSTPSTPIGSTSSIRIASAPVSPGLRAAHHVLDPGRVLEPGCRRRNRDRLAALAQDDVREAGHVVARLAEVARAIRRRGVAKLHVQ